MVTKIGSRTRFDKRCNLNTSQMADKIIVALVKIWEKASAELLEPGFGVDDLPPENRSRENVRLRIKIE